MYTVCIMQAGHSIQYPPPWVTFVVCIMQADHSIQYPPPWVTFVGVTVKEVIFASPSSLIRQPSISSQKQIGSRSALHTQCHECIEIVVSVALLLNEGYELLDAENVTSNVTNRCKIFNASLSGHRLTKVSTSAYHSTICTRGWNNEG